MKAVGIVGSYRAGGMTDQAVSAVLEGAASRGAETDCILLREKDIRYCRNCRACCQEPGDAPGRCRLDDDMPGIIEALRTADLVVVGAPMNVGQVTALTRAFTERLLPLYHWQWGTRRPPTSRNFRTQPAAAVLVTSSAMPPTLARLLGPATMGALRTVASLLRATVVEELFFGPVPSRADAGLDRRARTAAHLAGARAVAQLDRLEWPLARHVFPYAARLGGAARELFDLGRLVAGR